AVPRGVMIAQRDERAQSRAAGGEGALLASGRAACAAAAVAYALLTLAVLSPVVGRPTEVLPYHAMLEPPFSDLDHHDQVFAMWEVSRNARVLTTRPWALGGPGQCFPMPRPHTLGEHAFGEGLLAAVPWALSRDPILTYNVVIALTLWIPALAMFRLASYWTASAGAAFVAGALFAFQPARLIDPAHPFVHGDLWAPLVLLYGHRTFYDRRWRDAIALGAFASLALLESLYQIVALALVLVPYGIHLVVRFRRNLGAVLPKLALALAMAGAVAFLVFAPYLATRAEFGILQGRGTFAPPASDYVTPRKNAFVGVALGVLALIGIADRLRGRRVVHGDDPRLALLAGGLLVAWSAAAGVFVPIAGLWLRSPMRALAKVVPGLDAVRALPIIRMGFTLVLALLAAYGVGALGERFRARGRALVAAIAAAAIAVELAVPDASRWSFGKTLALAGWQARPPAPEVEFYRSLPDGAVLDLPYRPMAVGMMRDLAHDLLAAAYHQK